MCTNNLWKTSLHTDRELRREWDTEHEKITFQTKTGSSLCFQFSTNSVVSLSPPVISRLSLCLSLLWLILSVIIHSSRRYQINARTEMALRYNDISPLENHHCAVAFQIFSRPDCNIFFNFDPEAFKQIRQVLMCSCRNRRIVWVNKYITVAKIII